MADTHHPEFLERLPEDLFEALAGVDLILHAGDVGGRSSLDQLAQIAPVEAVRGDHDPRLDLPVTRMVEVAGRRIALVHGNRSRLVEEPFTLIGTLSLGLYWPSSGIRPWLRRRFPDADVIVYGHTHELAAETIDGALIVNPGAVYVVNPAEAGRRLTRRPNWFEWSWLQVVRHRRRWPPPSIAILDLSPEGIILTPVLLASSG